MTKIFYLDRASGEVKQEHVYGKYFVELAYGDTLTARLFQACFLKFLTKSSLFSRLYGKLQKKPASQKKIKPFIEKYHVEISEFLEPPEGFQCFNDFFIRRIKPEARPFDKDENVAVMPADGRYLVVPDLLKMEHFYVKGQRLDLKKLLQDEELAGQYEDGAMVFARLCPIDYHRFHFPFDCEIKSPKLINGFLSSVNPMALRKNLAILSENKRFLTELETQRFGRVLYLEVGATAVGSVVHTAKENAFAKKGEEKGYFEFGGSSVILLFQKGAISFDKDSLKASKEKLEVKANMGTTLGVATQS